LPVYINNDGDLYAYGEALGGILPEVNGKLAESGSPKRYKNLIGLTLGTGFGGGIVSYDRLYLGDNAMAAEVYAFRNKLNPEWFAEDGVSIRAVKYFYSEFSGQNSDDLSPKDIFDIAKGNKDGNAEAASKAFASVGEIIGDVVAHLITTLDGIVVIGGGLAGASELIFPAMLKEINSDFLLPDGEPMERLVQKVVNLDNEEGMNAIINQKTIDVKVPGSEKTVKYNPEALLGVGVSRIGASKAIALGAYAYALSALDGK
jgi:glucokinase